MSTVSADTDYDQGYDVNPSLNTWNKPNGLSMPPPTNEYRKYSPDLDKNSTTTIKTEITTTSKNIEGEPEAQVRLSLLSPVSNPVFHHSVDEIPHVLDKLDDTLPPKLPSTDSLPSKDQVVEKVTQLSSQVKEKATQLSSQVADKASQISGQVQEKASQVSNSETVANIQSGNYFQRTKTFLEQFFNSSEDEDGDTSSGTSSEEDETETTTTTTVTTEEKNPAMMTPLEREAYAYKLQALDMRNKSIQLQYQIDERQKQVDAIKESQSVTGQIKESVNSALASAKEGAASAVSQVSDAVNSNLHSALGLNENEPINSATLLSQPRIEQTADKLAKPVPVIVESTLSTVEMIQSFCQTYFYSYQAFFLALRQQSLPMQICYGILVVTHVLLPLLFLDKPASRSVLESFLFVVFCSHFIYFMTNHLKFLFLAHIFFIPMILTLLFTAGWTWEQNVNSVLEMPWYELPLHPILIRAYFYGVWVRAACMTTAMLLTLDSITINALYQRYLIRSNTHSRVSTKLRSNRYSSSTSKTVRKGGLKRKNNPIPTAKKNKALKPVETDTHEPTTISTGKNAAPSSKWVKKEETTTNTNSFPSPVAAFNLPSSDFSINSGSSSPSVPTQSPIATSAVSPRTYMNLPVADDINSVRVESHEKPNVLDEGLRQRTNITVGL